METVPLKRVFFWTTYVFGTLAFIFGLLLAQVPRGHNKDFRLDLSIWGTSFCLLLICLLLVKRISAHRGTEGDPGGTYFLFSIFSVGELCFCSYFLVSILIEVVTH